MRFPIGGWVSRKRLEGGVAAVSRGEREREREKCERELVVELQPAKIRGDRERERLEREWRRGVAATTSSNEGSNVNSQAESVDHAVLGAWLEQMQLDHLVAKQN
ncbi:hypothetical protein TIFTF001_034274 [Ficus carica]|uniref:Uncharacterized protein n=1 Tax=Ficus carica TaxID=3494 RepID=A0AA88E7H6_FICCA|nr:hypothetical protein TIFTF001_034274 [Ficus carica]